MDDYVAARSDDIPEIDAMTLMECVMTSDCYTSVEIRNVKATRYVRGSVQ